MRQQLCSRMNLRPGNLLAMAVAAGIAGCVFSSSSQAAVRAWSTAPENGNFSGLNWTASTVPGAATSTFAAGDTPFFGISSITTLNNDLAPGSSVLGFTFTSNASSFVIGGNAVTLGSDINNGSTSAQVINTDLAFTSIRNIYTGNQQTAGDVTLGGLLSGTGGGFGITGPGTVTFNGAVSNTYTGTTTVNLGTLRLDFSNMATPINLIRSGNAITLQNNGTLIVTGKSGAATSQTTGAFANNSGSTRLIFQQNGATSLNFTMGTFTRGGGAGAAIDVTLPTTGTVTTTTMTQAQGIVVGGGVAYATANGGTTWLANTSGTLSALANASYLTGAANYFTGKNVDVADGDSITVASGAGFTLRFNTASSNLTINGAYKLNGGGSGQGGGILVTPTGTNSTINGGSIAGSTTSNRELIVHDYGNLTINSVIANPDATATPFTKTGTGTTTISAVNTYTGNTNILAGTLVMRGNNQANSALVQLRAGANLTAVANAGNTADGVSTAIGSASSTISFSNISGGSGSVINGVTFLADENVTFAGGATGLTGMAGNQMINFDVSPVTAGVSAKTISFSTSSTSSVGSSGSPGPILNVTSSNGSTLALGNFTINNNATFSVNATTGNLITGSLLNSPGSGLIKDGNGAWTINGAMTARGQMLVNGGTLILNSSSNGGTNGNWTGGALIAASGKLALRGSSAGAATTSATQNASAATGTLNLGASASANGGGTLELQANGSNTVSGVSTAVSTGQVINFGHNSTLELRSDSSVAFNPSDVTGWNNAVVNLSVNTVSSGTGQTLTLDRSNGSAIGYANAVTVNVTGGNSYTLGLGTVNNTAAGSSLVLNPTTASVALAGYTSNASAGSTLVLGGTDTSGNSRVAGAINDPATSQVTSLTKSGTSTWNLNGVNGYTGQTTINGGRLNVNGSLHASSAVAVNAGGRLGGTGAVNGTVTVTGGKIDLTDGTIGTLTVGGLTMSDTASSYRAELNLANDQSDVLEIAGGIDLNGTLELVILNADSFSGTKTYTLINNAGGVIGGDFMAIHPTLAISYTSSKFGGDGNDYTVTVTGVPEPTILSLSALTAMGLLRRRRSAQSR